MSRPGGLSSTLTSLLRAQHGSALDNVEDSDLDKRIADIMVQDAKERQKQWGTMGFTAYLDDQDAEEGPARKTNKRFLASMMRNVDSHNQSLIQAELDSARKVQQERKKEDGNRSARLFGSAMQSATRSRPDKGKGKAKEDPEVAHSASAQRDEEYQGKERSSRHRDRSESPKRRRRHREDYSDESEYEREKERRRRRRRRDDEDKESSRRSRRREDDHDRSRSHRSKDEKESSQRHRDDESRSIRRDRDKDDDRHRSSRRDRSRDRHPSSKHRTEDDAEPSRTASASVEPSGSAKRAPSLPPVVEKPANGLDSKSNGTAKLSRKELESLHPTEVFMLTGGKSIELSPSPPPEPEPKRRKRPRTPPPIARVQVARESEDDLGPGIIPPSRSTPAPSSKMDKYFQKSYDPRLDVSLEDLTDPHTGFIKEGAFDDWSTMMDVMKAQREYKKEKGMREAEERFQAAERQAEKRKAREKAADLEKDKNRRRAAGIDSDEDDYGPQPRTKEAGYTAPAGAGMMGMRYVKKGGMREWDLGKETPT